MEIKPLRNALLTARSRGFCVIPVHGNREFGGCTCGKIECPSIGKHPTPVEWQKKASNDEARIRELFAGLTNEFNYGIVTGPASGVFVLDVDGPTGQASLDALEEIHGKLPLTLQTNTGRGKHLFFKYPTGRKVHTRSKIADNLDARGEGGQVVGPGSTHYSGTKYEWDFPGADVLEAPEWLLELVCGETIKPDHKSKLDLSDIPKRSTLNINDLPPWDADDVLEMLTFIHPDSCYDDWFKIGMAIKSYGLPFNIWDDWSRSGAKYDASIMVDKWNSFRGSGVTIGTLYYHAENGGFKPKREPNYQTPPDPTYKTDKTYQDTPDPETGEFKEVPPDPPEGEEERPAGNKSALYYIPARDIHPSLEVNDFVQGLLGEGEMSVVYGESNCGKTFFMSDLSFHIAQGVKWRDRRVDQGGVMYAALEGGRGIRNRISAYRKDRLILDKNMPFAVLPCQLDFFSPANNINEFIELIFTAEKDIGTPKLIVIDTLARAMAGGDENSGEDMGMLVRYADHIRHHTGAHVCFIHHSGKNKALGARGHSSLRAAVDTEIEISRGDDQEFSVVKNVKQREMEMADDMFFSLKSVELGKNKYDEVVSSCVVLPIDGLEEKQSVVTLTANEQFVFDALVAALITGGVKRNIFTDSPPINSVEYYQLEDEMVMRGSKEMIKKDGSSTVKSTTDSVRKALKKKGKINCNQRYIWLANDD